MLLLIGIRLTFRVRLGRCGLRNFGDAVRNEIHYVESRNALLVQEIHGVRILLAENRHQYICAGDFLLARRLHVQDGALDHALKSERRLRIDILSADDRRMFVDEIRQELAQFLDVGRARAQDFRRRWIIQHG